jgi:hypothetical protein
MGLADWKYTLCYFIPIPIQRWSTTKIWEFVDNLCDNTGNMWVVWTREKKYNRCLLTLLILPYNLFKYSSAGNITTILAYQEVTNWNVHKFEATAVGLSDVKLALILIAVSFWGPGMVSAQFLLTLPHKVHAFLWQNDCTLPSGTNKSVIYWWWAVLWHNYMTYINSTAEVGDYCYSEV